MLKSFLVVASLLVVSTSYAEKSEGLLELLPERSVVAPGETLNIRYRITNRDQRQMPVECEPLRFVSQIPQGWANLPPKVTYCLPPEETHEGHLMTLTIPKDEKTGQHLIFTKALRDHGALRKMASDALVVRISFCGPVDEITVEPPPLGASQKRGLARFQGVKAGCRYILESSDDLSSWKAEEIFTAHHDGEYFTAEVDTSTPKKFFKVSFLEAL